MTTPARPLLRLSRAPAVVAAALTWSLAGCADDATTPTGPDSPAAPTASAAAAAAPLVWRVVSAGDTHTCGVTKDDRAWCWGSNFTGQLGDGTSSDHAFPAPVAGGLRFRSVTVGRVHSCGITTDDLAYCWGLGPLGNGTVFTSRQPLPVAGGRRFATVRSGLDHTCGITTAGKAWCWGNNRHGQIGNFSRVNQPTPAAVGGNHTWRWINPGGLHTCGVTTDSRAYCWGRNVEGQLGGGTTRSSIGSPVAVSGGLAFRNVSAGHFQTCGVTPADRAYCWGQNSTGQLGDGTETPRSQPRPVAGTRRYHNTSEPVLLLRPDPGRPGSLLGIQSARRARGWDHHQPSHARAPGRRSDADPAQCRLQPRLRSDRAGPRLVLGRQPLRPARRRHQGAANGARVGGEPDVKDGTSGRLGLLSSSPAPGRPSEPRPTDSSHRAAALAWVRRRA